LRDRLAEANAKLGHVLCEYDDPGQMAVDLDRRTVQRPHLVPIDETFRDLNDGVIDRAIITTPPQVGKTQRGAVWGTFWWMAKHPNDPVILTSYGADLAASRGRMVRSLVSQYGAAFGLRLATDQSARNNWHTTSGAVMRTGGNDSGLSGEPSAFMVIDDPHKNRAEADSPQKRKQIIDTYSSSLLSRLRPGAPMLMILTRWHDDDLAGYVLKEEGSEAEGGRWRVLHLPAVADPKFGPDPLGRAPGQPLTHPFIDPDAPDGTDAAARHWQEKKRTSSVRDWHSLYQGDPQPSEGSLLTQEMMAARRVAPPPMSEMSRVVVAVDPSGGGRDEAGVVGGGLLGHGTTSKLWWTHDRSGRMSADQWSREACLLAAEISADVIVFEHNYGGDQAHLIIRTAWDALQREGEILPDRLCPMIEAVHAKRGKKLRAEPVAQQVIEDRIRIAPGLLDLEAEWVTWQADSNWSPGRIDGSCYIAYKLLAIPGSDAMISVLTDKRMSEITGGRTAVTQRRIVR
jgi:hypothetical protein